MVPLVLLRNDTLGCCVCACALIYPMNACEASAEVLFRHRVLLAQEGSAGSPCRRGAWRKRCGSEAGSWGHEREGWPVHSRGRSLKTKKIEGRGACSVGALEWD